MAVLPQFQNWNDRLRQELQNDNRPILEPSLSYGSPIQHTQWMIKIAIVLSVWELIKKADLKITFCFTKTVESDRICPRHPGSVSFIQLP